MPSEAETHLRQRLIEAADWGEEQYRVHYNNIGQM